MIESWKVNYSEFVAEAGNGPYDDIADYLIDQLKWEWHDQYIANTAFETDIIESPEKSLIYLFDTEVVEKDEISLKAGRVVAVYGRVCGDASMRFTSSQLRGRCMGPTE